MASSRHLEHATTHKWRALRSCLQSQHPSIPSSVLGRCCRKVSNTSTLDTQDNAWSFRWSEDGILRDIMDVSMERIDFHSLLIHLPLPPQPAFHSLFPLCRLFTTRVKLLAFWPFVPLWLQNNPLRANNEVVGLYAAMSGEFREILATGRETDFQTASKRLASWIFCSICFKQMIYRTALSLKSTCDHFRVVDCIPVYEGDPVWPGDRTDQFVWTLMPQVAHYYSRTTVETSWQQGPPAIDTQSTIGSRALNWAWTAMHVFQRFWISRSLYSAVAGISNNTHVPCKTRKLLVACSFLRNKKFKTENVHVVSARNTVL
jgi:hypothetical protein